MKKNWKHKWLKISINKEQEEINSHMKSIAQERNSEKKIEGMYARKE